MNLIARYTRWLHTQWPAGQPETLPVVREGGATNVPGLYVVGDLSGVPLLKLSVNAGTRVVRRIHGELQGRGGKASESDADILDVAIIGGGTAGFAAAKEAEKLGLRYLVFEASEPFSTIVNFPKEKPIYKYPTDMGVDGDLDFHDKSDVKEGLLEDLREQTVDQGLKYVHGRASHVERDGKLFEVVLPDPASEPDGVDLGEASFALGAERVKARRVVVAIGRSGNYRKLGVPGEDKAHKVFNRLHDPKDFAGQNVLVVGGGDSALEAAVALVEAGADVTLSYRKDEFNRPKPENQEKIQQLTERDGKLGLVMSSNVSEIRDTEVDLDNKDGEKKTLNNDAVFALIGREPPLDFFRRSGVHILGERNAKWWSTLTIMLVFCVWLYHWKSGKGLLGLNALKLPAFLDLNPAVLWDAIKASGIGAYFSDLSTFGGTLALSASGRSFYYTLAYASIVVVFGVRRILRRKTPYVKWQTLTLMAIQVVPLFLLPEIILPWLGHNGVFDTGIGKWFADTFFPVVDYGHGREYWRAYGFILAWPLMAWNWFTHEPLWGWLVLGFLQTFVAIPLMIRFWGKGAYCGWVCSCGALAETLGDTQRHKMPHGPFWNRFNMVGQVFLAFVVLIMLLRIAGWVLPESVHSEVNGVSFRSENETVITFSRPPGVDWEIDEIWSVSVSDYSGSAGWDKLGIRLNGPSNVQVGDQVVVKTFASSLGDTSRRFFDIASGGIPLFSYAYMVDLIWAGILGVALYFHFSGRVWCRFACPLAALMHIYARFSRFRILADKKKCISCNVCTSVCHQGIDIMSFANKGKPMEDPECVRCSACVQMCPTGVLSFGQIDPKTGEVMKVDPAWLAASPVNIAEGEVTVNGKKLR